MAEQKDTKANEKRFETIKKEKKKILMKAFSDFSKRTLTETERNMRKFAIELNDFLQIILSITNPRPHELIYPIDIDDPKEVKHLEKLKQLLNADDPSTKNFAPDTVKFLKEFGNPRKQPTYMFIFNHNGDIREFSRYLNLKTWKVLSDLNFYNDDLSVKLPLNTRQITKKFKICMYMNPQRFADFYKSKKNINLQRDNKVFLIYDDHGHSYKTTYNTFKTCLWAFSNTDHTMIPNIFFSKSLLSLKRNCFRIYVLWMIITYGLGMELKSESIISMLHNYWRKFLIEEPYDPRLFLLIEAFLGFLPDY